jgi:hypothetical protein
MSDPANIPGDPGGLLALGGQLQSAAAGIAGVAGPLAAHELPDWAGAGGDAFRDSLGTFPSELSQVHGALDSAGTRIRSFAQDLENYQYTAKSLASQIAEKNAELEAAKARADAAQTDVNAKQLAHDLTHDPVSLATARSALATAKSSLSSATAAVSSAGDEVSALADRAEANFENYVRAAADAASDIERGISDVRSFVGGAEAKVSHLAHSFGHWLSHKTREGMHAVKTGIDDVGDGVEDAMDHPLKALEKVGGTALSVTKHFGEGMLTNAKDIGADVDYISHHPGSLKGWEHLAGHVAELTGKVGLVAGIAIVAVAAAPEEAVAASVAAGVGTVGDAVATVGLVATGAKTGIDVAEVVKGEESAKVLVGDAFDDAVSVVGMHGESVDAEDDPLMNPVTDEKVNVKMPGADVRTLKTSMGYRNALDDYSAALGDGSTPAAALQGLSSGQQELLMASSQDLGTASQRATARVAIDSSIADQRTDIIHDRLTEIATDKLQEYDTDKINQLMGVSSDSDTPE